MQRACAHQESVLQQMGNLELLITQTSQPTQQLISRVSQPVMRVT